MRKILAFTLLLMPCVLISAPSFSLLDVFQLLGRRTNDPQAVSLLSKMGPADTVIQSSWEKSIFYADKTIEVYCSVNIISFVVFYPDAYDGRLPLGLKQKANTDDLAQYFPISIKPRNQFEDSTRFVRGDFFDGGGLRILVFKEPFRICGGRELLFSEAEYAQSQSLLQENTPASLSKLAELEMQVYERMKHYREKLDQLEAENTRTVEAPASTTELLVIHPTNVKKGMYVSFHDHPYSLEGPKLKKKEFESQLASAILKYTTIDLPGCGEFTRSRRLLQVTMGDKSYNPTYVLGIIDYK